MLTVFPHSSTLSPLLFALPISKNIKTETFRVEKEPILSTSLLQGRGNDPGVLNLLQLDIGLVLLDGFSDELGRSSLTLSLDNHSLLLLAGLVDDEGCPLGFLLGDLLGFDGGGELGREGKVLD